MSTKSPKFYRLKNDKNIIYKFFIETMILSDFIATWMFFYAVNEVNINRDSWSFAFNIGQKMALRAIYARSKMSTYEVKAHSAIFSRYCKQLIASPYWYYLLPILSTILEHNFYFNIAKRPSFSSAKETAM